MTTIIICGAITVAMLAIGFATWTVTKPKKNPENPLTETLVAKTIRLVDAQPDSWQIWGNYKTTSGGQMTGFEYRPGKEATKVCRIRLEDTGHLTYITEELKSEARKGESVQGLINISKKQQKRLKAAYEGLKCERLIRMLDRIGLNED